MNRIIEDTSIQMTVRENIVTYRFCMFGLLLNTREHMDLATIRDYALAKPGTFEDTPFGPDTLVFKVMGRMFALASLDTTPTTINLKAEPEHAVELRERYEAVQPGYHQNKKHWNTVTLDGSIPDDELYAMVDHSYERVVLGLKKSEREELEGLR
jgi:predicted DNA-binding protein (MmcQ/YjbR family)